MVGAARTLFAPVTGVPTLPSPTASHDTRRVYYFSRLPPCTNPVQALNWQVLRTRTRKTSGPLYKMNPVMTG